VRDFKFLIRILPYCICLLFFIAYFTLTVVRHNHYQSYGYDLGINDQTVWLYSKLKLPLTTIDPLPGKSKLAEHVELVYPLIAPAYWIWSSPVMLILLQTASICLSAILVYKLAKKYKLSEITSNILVVVYLMFYGVQFGLWTDVHSSIFAAAFVMGFIYFLDLRKYKFTLLFFLLSITAKESVGSAIFFISCVYFWYRREKIILLYLISSAAYMFFIFYVFFPQIMHVPYLYANKEGLFSNLNPLSLIDTQEKQSTIFHSFASWGFISLLSPITLLPVLIHFYKFFVVASDLQSAQGLFGQYRVGLAPLFAFSTIWTLKRFSYRWQTILSLWLLLATFCMQYFLHLPLSYLSKQWFWAEPAAVKNINYVIGNILPDNASVVSQNNISPHISQRNEIYTLYPKDQTFSKNSPCGKETCSWLRWDGSPEFLIVDTDSTWDARHFLIDRNDFLDGLLNLENEKVVEKYKQVGTTILYLVKKDPNLYD
jgi:uncharacterized membrane protein